MRKPLSFKIAWGEFYNLLARIRIKPEKLDLSSRLPQGLLDWWLCLNDFTTLYETCRFYGQHPIIKIHYIRGFISYISQVKKNEKFRASLGFSYAKAFLPRVACALTWHINSFDSRRP
jgi:hypothetical protein